MLQEIFESITPDNIKDIEVLKASMEIFIKNLEENSPISSDINELYYDDNMGVRTALIQTFLQNFHKVLTDAQNDVIVAERIDKHKIDYKDNLIGSSFFNDVEAYIKSEHTSTSKVFNQKKGTTSAITYIYNLVRDFGINNSEVDYFEIKEGRYFILEIMGSVYKELYDNIVNPLSHPVGFVYLYNQILTHHVSDKFGIDSSYNMKDLEVRCISGNIDIYTDLTLEEATQKLLNKLNPVSGVKYTQDYIDEYITITTGKTILDIEADGDINRPSLIYHFDDNTSLIQVSNPIEVYHYQTGEDYTKNSIKDYSNTHCSIYSAYSLDTIIKYSSQIVETMVEFFIGGIRENNNGVPGETLLGTEDKLKSFKVGGQPALLTDEYNGNSRDTTSSYVTVLIGENYDGNFSAPDTLIDGLYTQGSDISETVFSKLLNEDTFIANGRTFDNYDTSDVMKLTYNDTLVDDIEFEFVGAPEIYIYSIDNFYIKTEDDKYLFAEANS